MVEAVLGRGENFSSTDTEILGKQYIVYYIPFCQPDGNTPVGMVFLGEEYQKVSDIVMASCMKIVAGVHNLDQSLQGIVTEIQDQSRALKEISGSCLSEAKKASTTTEEISKVIQQIAANTEESAASIEEVAHIVTNTAEEMDGFQKIAGILNEKVDVFQFL